MTTTEVKQKKLTDVRPRVVKKGAKTYHYWEVDYSDTPGMCVYRGRHKTATHRHRETFRTQAEAVEREGEVLKALGRGIPALPCRDMTLGKAADKYPEAKPRKKSLAEDKRLLGLLKEAFGANTRLVDITAGRIAAYRHRLLGTK